MSRGEEKVLKAPWFWEYVPGIIAYPKGFTFVISQLKRGYTKSKQVNRMAL